MEQPVSVIQIARQRFASEGLELPYIPVGLEGQLHQRSDWVFGSRLDTPLPYDVMWFINEMLNQPVTDYLLFGHDGHGINSYAMHDFRVQPWLALFDQCAWGGALMDNETALAMVQSHFNHSRIIAQLAEDAHQAGLLPEASCLLVITSEVLGPRWGYFQPGTFQQFDLIPFHTALTGLEILLDVRLMLNRLLDEA